MDTAVTTQPQVPGTSQQDTPPQHTSAPAPAPAVAAVSLKLPTFWAQQPLVWFAQAEAQFELRSITADRTKYFYLVSALDQDTAGRVLDVLQAPPQANAYPALKARLLDSFGLSETQRARAILHFPELGDQSPSQVMDKLLAYLGDHQGCFLFRQVFLDRMPEDIRGALVQSGLQDLRALAKLADRLWQNRAVDAPVLSAMQSAPSDTLALCAVKRRPPSTSMGKDTSHGGLCYFHARFGAQARRCKPPCKFAAATPSGNGSTGRV